MADDKKLIELLRDAISIEESYINGFIKFIKPEISEASIGAEDLKRVYNMLEIMESDSKRHLRTDKDILARLTK
jgi:hypothetical protein